MLPISEPSLISALDRDAAMHGDRAASAAATRLRNSPYQALRDIVCELREGVLTLRGRVPSYYLKQLAQALLQDLADVSGVDNQLDVVAPQSAHWPDRGGSHVGGPLSRRPR
jgi:hypothetical protein